MRRTTFFMVPLTISLFSSMLLTLLVPRVPAPNPTTWHVPGDFPSIQAAIDAASSNDTIIVAPGIYYEHLSIQHKNNLTIIGEDPATTIIDGSQTGSIIYLSGSNEIAITGFIMQNAIYGVNMVQSGNCTIGSSVINASTENPFFPAAAITMSESSDNRITNNTLTSNNGYGIRNTIDSNENTIANNTVADNKHGISIESSMNATLTNNSLTGNTYNFGVQGAYTHEFIHNIDTSNAIEGKPIFYLISQADLTISPATFPSLGYLAIVNSNNVTVENIDMSDNLQGVLLVNTTDSLVRDTNLLNNFCGIELRRSSFNSVENNEVEANQEEQTALFLIRAEYNSITNNKITSNHKGIYMLDYSTNNTIAQNTISDNWYGMHIQGFSSGNTLYHNNLVNNTEQVSNSWSNNTWDNGYPSGGNHWSDYAGEDQNGDGIGDTPY
ncbi:MAG: NosD domain-containing protein, partial [Candidatus Bathyarchaeota archaeon]